MKSGFTLTELMIVIVLIGVLSLLGVNMFIAAQRQGRDSRRTGDLKTIQSSLESYFATLGTYPLNCDPGAGYLPQGFPKDPLTGTAYTAASCTGTAYCFCVQLENTTTKGNSTANNCSNYASGQFFCISNLQ